MFSYVFHVVAASLICLATASLKEGHESFQEKHRKSEDHKEMDHEAILGSHKTADEYDHLPPEEAKARLRKLVEKMDLNKDGKIVKEELTDWVHKSLMDLDLEDLEERFPAADKNKDGLITWEEYVKDSFGDGDDMEEDMKRYMAEDKRYFFAADRNEDGKLNKQEFAAFQRPENYDYMHDIMMHNVMTDRDKNHDGKLDIDEFMHDTDEEKDGSEWYQAERKKFGAEYDKNQDGFLDRDEVKDWLTPDMSRTAADEADHLIAQTDADDDNALSYDEIVDEHDLWVGSEATNYGKKLHDEM